PLDRDDEAREPQRAQVGERPVDDRAPRHRDHGRVLDVREREQALGHTPGRGNEDGDFAAGGRRHRFERGSPSKRFSPSCRALARGDAGQKCSRASMENTPVEPASGPSTTTHTSCWKPVLFVYVNVSGTPGPPTSEPARHEDTVKLPFPWQVAI